jgi:hypothetical protein
MIFACAMSALMVSARAAATKARTRDRMRRFFLQIKCIAKPTPHRILNLNAEFAGRRQ